jgi:hypothetical protein
VPERAGGRCPGLQRYDPRLSGGKLAGMESGQKARPGFFAMLVTFVRWWRLILASMQDTQATDPPPAFVAVAVREQGWSAARVANFYEGLLSDKATELATFVARARDVEQQVRTARAQAYWEGAQALEAHLLALVDDPESSAPVPEDVRTYWEANGPQVLKHFSLTGEA